MELNLYIANEEIAARLGLNCARPLIFENPEEEWRFSMQGTCFVCRYKSLNLVITAKHCLHHWSADRVRIRKIPEDLEFLKLTALSCPLDDGEDSSDLAAFLIDRNSIGGTPADPLPLDLTSCTGRRPLEHETLLVVGYPSQSNSVDYDRLELNTKGYALHGRYEALFESEHCSIIRFESVADLRSLDGLSGAPVFAFEKSGEKSYGRRFIGVLIRGSIGSGQGRFIESSRVIRLLDFIVSNTAIQQPM